MTALTRTPDNLNFLQPNKFQLNFSRLPNVQYFCQTVSIPGISLSEAVITNPFVDIYSPGEKAIYDLMTVTFVIDEDLKSWIEIHDWIRAMTKVKDFEEYKRLPALKMRTAGLEDKQPQFSDASITILSSANNPIYKFKFYDCFPTTLSSFIMNTGDGPDTQLTADVTFRYNYYDIEKMY